MTHYTIPISSATTVLIGILEAKLLPKFALTGRICAEKFVSLLDILRGGCWPLWVVCAHAEIDYISK